MSSPISPPYLSPQPLLRAASTVFRVTTVTAWESLVCLCSWCYRASAPSGRAVAGNGSIQYHCKQGGVRLLSFMLLDQERGFHLAVVFRSAWSKPKVICHVTRQWPEWHIDCMASCSTFSLFSKQITLWVLVPCQNQAVLCVSWLVAFCSFVSSHSGFRSQIVT